MIECFFSYDYEVFFVCGCGELFGLGNVQLFFLLMLMFDWIIEILEIGGEYDKGFIWVEFDIKLDLWFFLCYF